MTDRYEGQLPTWQVPTVERPASWMTQWRSFDVPRIWDMLRDDVQWPAIEQVTGFGALADLLEEHFKQWRGKRDKAAQAWQSPAADELLKRLDAYGLDLIKDAAYARQTASALNDTIVALAKAREDVRPLVERWNKVTTEWTPFFWMSEASKLNHKARVVMFETDKVVASARPYIAVPVPLRPLVAPQTVIEQPGHDNNRTEDGSNIGSSVPRDQVPPIPGYEPVSGTPITPELAGSIGAPQMIPAVPGQPVSMLPIPPGSPYAPFGGAYILPGPGVGRGGYVVPMPRTPGSAGPVGGRSLMPPMIAGSGGGGGGASGMMPVPLGGMPGGGSGSHGSIYRRPTVKWENEAGVPPVIKIEEDEFVLNQPTPKQEEEFQDWFSDLAYPWRAEFKNADGAQVTIRTVEK